MVINMTKDILELGVLILIFIGVLGLTYLVTKKIALLNNSFNYNKNMKIIETIQISQGQYLYIIEVGNEYHLIGSSHKGNICYCTNIDGEKLNLEEHITPNFKEQLSILMKGKQKNEYEEK